MRQQPLLHRQFYRSPCHRLLSRRPLLLCNLQPLRPLTARLRPDRQSGCRSHRYPISTVSITCDSRRCHSKTTLLFNNQLFCSPLHRTYNFHHHPPPSTHHLSFLLRNKYLKNLKHCIIRTTSLDKTAGPSADKLPSFSPTCLLCRVPCPYKGSIRFIVTGSAYWMNILIENVGGPGDIGKVEVAPAGGNYFIPIHQSWGAVRLPPYSLPLTSYLSIHSISILATPLLTLTLTLPLL